VATLRRGVKLFETKKYLTPARTNELVHSGRRRRNDAAEKIERWKLIQTRGDAAAWRETFRDEEIPHAATQLRSGKNWKIEIKTNSWRRCGVAWNFLRRRNTSRGDAATQREGSED